MKTLPEFVRFLADGLKKTDDNELDLKRLLFETVRAFKDFLGHDHADTKTIQNLHFDYMRAVTNKTPYEIIKIDTEFLPPTKDFLRKKFLAYKRESGDKTVMPSPVTFRNVTPSSKSIPTRLFDLTEKQAKHSESIKDYTSVPSPPKKKTFWSNTWVQIVASGIISALATKIIDALWDIDKWFPKVAKVAGSTSLNSFLTFISIGITVYGIIHTIRKRQN